MDAAEFKNYLEIDRHNLDEELIQHPSLYYKISEQLVTAIDARDQAKQFLKEIDAQCNLTIRQRLISEGGKVTEALVESNLQIDKAHTSAVDDHLSKSAKVEELAALKQAFEHRAYMLRELCSLYTAGYFSNTSVRTGQAQHQEKEVENTKDVIGKKRVDRMTRRRLKNAESIPD